VSWTARPQVDDDLIAGREFIRADNDRAARAFLDTAFETFDAIAAFPKMGAAARFHHPGLRGLRFLVLPHPFNRWLVFYRLAGRRVVIERVLYGNVNWQQAPERFF
jgi:plasmid stabilization system protein ParE